MGRNESKRSSVFVGYLTTGAKHDLYFDFPTRVSQGVCGRLLLLSEDPNTTDESSTCFGIPTS